jgi:segregation and condensation protein B
MSLKAKIEAVIYASEEPVTLAQLIGLLGHEAQAELDQQAAQLAAAQPSLSLNETEVDLEEAAESDPTLNPDSSSEVPAEASAPVSETPQTEAEQGTEPPVTETAAENAAENVAAPAEPSADEVAARAAKAEKEKARELRDYFRTLLEVLISDYASSDRGIEIREVAGGYRLATKPEYHDAVRGFVKSLKPPLKLSLQALETLAVVAYKQPVTAPEISEIRGVDTGGVLGSLMTRKLITTAGRKQVIGRPILYKTTKDFLLRFGLKDIAELPSIEEFEKMAGELADNEPLQEEMEMSHALQADGSPDTADNPLDITVEDALEDNPVKDNVSDIHPVSKETVPSEHAAAQQAHHDPNPGEE